MKTPALILLLFALNSNFTFDKRKLSYPVIISKSDLIVEGKISNVSFSVYEYDFEITDFLKGRSEKNITIDMWKEWTCDKRIESPRKGQKLLLFLTKNKNGEYEIINGSTGEIFISENNTLKTYVNDNFPKLNEFKTGIKMFSKSYDYNGSLHPSYKERTFFRRLIKHSTIDSMMTKNSFFKSMVEQIEKKIINN